MARSIWKGSITFGLVNIPVGLYAAEQREELSLHLLDKRNMARVRYKRVNEENGKEVPWEDTVRGYEFQDGKYVVLSDEDLQRASPEKTQTIDIMDFVDLDDISPVYFDKPYYLAPDKRGAKSYALLRETLKKTRKIGIATVVIRTKQYLAAVIAQDDVIVLNILRYGHELRDANDLDLPSGRQGVTDREIDMAERLVQGMVDTWEPERYKDTYFRDLKKMIEKRVEAGQLESAPPPTEEEKRPARSNVVDLMALLKQSVEQGGRAPAKKAPAKKTPAKKTPAKKTAAKKTPHKAAAKKRKSA
jgi:DNA end-binding protein Ku